MYISLLCHIFLSREILHIHKLITEWRRESGRLWFLYVHWIGKPTGLRKFYISTNLGHTLKARSSQCQRRSTEQVLTSRCQRRWRIREFICENKREVMQGISDGIKSSRRNANMALFYWMHGALYLKELCALKSKEPIARCRNGD